MKPTLRLKGALCACLPLLVLNFSARSQGWDTLPWRSHTDYKLQPLNKSHAATGILYDRVFPLANLDEYTSSLSYTDTTSPRHFMQAYYEIYNAALNTVGWRTPEALDAAISAGSVKKEHPIGLFRYTFNSLDTNAFEDNLVDTNANGQFIDIANRPRSPYFTHTAFLASVLLAEDEVLDSGRHTFYYDPKFFVTNDSLSITEISIDFGDGQGWQTRNFNNPNARGMFSWVAELAGGTLFGRILISGLSIAGQAIVHGGVFNITVNNPKVYADLTPCKGGTKWVIEPDATALAAVNAQYGNPFADYTRKVNLPCPPPFNGVLCKTTIPVKDTAYFYFAGGGSCPTTPVVRRPIVFIDGFDPTNTRGVQQIYEDYINKQVTRPGSLGTLFGDYMLENGNGNSTDDYDFIILDFKHGNDLLERNALTLVKLLQELYQTYGSSFQQDIVLIGPSMGSLIAQYALAYMEHNNLPHHVKTYISFDGCHQGANVPIGLQNFVEYFTKKGIMKENKLIREGLYNGLAARQMLAHHHYANSQAPAPDALRTTFLQNLALVGEYPQNCRKVAIINGTNTGALNPNFIDPNQNLLRIYTQRKGWKSIWGACTDKICMKLDWACKTAPRSSSAQKVTELWTAEPIFNLLFWVPLGQTNKYASSIWNNSSQDDAPGGTFGTLFGTQN